MSMGESVFEVVKQSVAVREAAEMYGIAVGRGGMACCPFHDDRHPSMKVDTRFHCFGPLFWLRRRRRRDRLHRPAL